MPADPVDLAAAREWLTRCHWCGAALADCPEGTACCEGCYHSNVNNDSRAASLASLLDRVREEGRRSVFARSRVRDVNCPDQTCRARVGEKCDREVFGAPGRREPRSWHAARKRLAARVPEERRSPRDPSPDPASRGPEESERPT